MIFFDCDFDSRPMFPCLLSKGDPEIVIGRYSCMIPKGDWKVTHVNEQKAFAAADIEIKTKYGPMAYFRQFLIHEDSGKPRSAAYGKAAGQFVKNLLGPLGIPRGGLVCFTDDEDDVAERAVLESTEAFFDQLQDGQGELVTRGLYASGAVLEAAYAKKIIDVRWPTMSAGFDGTKALIAAGHYEFRQGLEVSFCGRVIDPDVFKDGVTPESVGCYVPYSATSLVA